MAAGGVVSHDGWHLSILIQPCALITLVFTLLCHHWTAIRVCEPFLTIHCVGPSALLVTLLPFQHTITAAVVVFNPPAFSSRPIVLDNTTSRFVFHLASTLCLALTSLPCLDTTTFP